MNLKHQLQKAYTVLDLCLPRQAHLLADPLSRWLKIGTALLGNLRLRIQTLEGSTPAGPLRLAYLGRQRHQSYLCDLVFDAPPGVQETVYTSLLDLRDAIAARRDTHDLIIVELPYPLLQPLSGREGFTTLPWLQHRLDLTAPRETIMAPLNHRNLKYSLRKVRKYRLEYTISRDPADFEQFYSQMYRPFVQARHGPHAAITESDLLRIYFDRGWLLQVRYEGEVVYASLQYERARAYHLRVSGARGGDARWLSAEAGAAAYYFSLQRALDRGCRVLDFGLTRPLLNDGVFCYKKRWGAAVSRSATLYQGLWIGVGRPGPAAADFMARHPFAWMDRHGHWHGFVVYPLKQSVSLRDLERAQKRYAAPGLTSLIAAAPGGFADDVHLPAVAGPVPSLGPAVQMSTARPSRFIPTDGQCQDSADSL